MAIKSVDIRRLAWVLAIVLLLPLAAGAQRPAVVIPRPPCVVKSFVPPAAPDTVAENVLDSLGTIAVSAQPGVSYMRNLLAVRFDDDAPQEQRQAAVDRVCGIVVGGDHSDGSDNGYYLVRLRGAESVSALDAAADAARRMPGVASAQTLALRQADAPQAPDAATAASSCADGNSGGWLRVAALKEMMASREPGEVQMVNGLGLGGVDTSVVRIVNNGAVCARVTAAIAQGAHVTLSHTPFLVLHAGARYVAFDPLGINRSFFLVDTSFVFRTVLR